MGADSTVPVSTTTPSTDGSPNDTAAASAAVAFAALSSTDTGELSRPGADELVLTSRASCSSQSSPGSCCARRLQNLASDANPRRGPTRARLKAPLVLVVGRGGVRLAERSADCSSGSRPSGSHEN